MTTAGAAPVAAGRVPHLKSVRAAGRRIGPMHSEQVVRSFAFRSDEPRAVGGGDTAPTPMEIIAGALNACIAVTVEAVAGERGIRIDAIETTSHAHIDVRGFRGTADVSPHFQDYALTVRVVCAADAEQSSALARDAERRCPAANLIRDAGLALRIGWEFEAAGDPGLSPAL